VGGGGASHYGGLPGRFPLCLGGRSEGERGVGAGRLAGLPCAVHLSMVPVYDFLCTRMACYASVCCQLCEPNHY
jgi:hypothetical protein